MCGRYSIHFSWAEVHAFSAGITVTTPTEEPEPAYNLAPTQSGWVIAPQGADRALARQMRWGLIPAWAKDVRIAYNTINARIESVADKPAFRSAWKSRRCLVPASGYYEWPGEGKAKQPYFIHSPRSPVIMFAGLWECWKPEQGGSIESYSIVTMDAAGALANLHDRMPLILRPNLLRDWMEGSAEEAAAIAHAAPIPALEWHAVDKAVGNVRNQGPGLIEPIPEQAQTGP